MSDDHFWGSRFGVYVVAAEMEGHLVGTLRSAFLFGPPSLYRLEVHEFAKGAPNTIVIWTARMAAQITTHPEFVSTAVERRFMLLPRDSTPVPRELSDLRRLEWTTPADIYWQWRVANGAPPDHVDRPWKG